MGTLLLCEGYPTIKLKIYARDEPGRGVNVAEPVKMGGPDSRRGKLPDIRSEEDTITFRITIGLPSGVPGQLLLRCERDGEIYVSIASVVLKDRR
jgi:hypothetical protein